MDCSLRSLIPWQVREGVRSALSFRRAKELGAMRSAIHRSQSFAVGFGGVLDDGRPIHGGAVKLLTLRASFPSDETAFSILYAVSSSSPERAEPLFKLCRKKGIPIVWNQNGVGYPAWAGRESERFNGPMRRLRGLADFVVYQSAFCEESANRFLGPSRAPSCLLYNPVDIVRFHPAPEKSRPGPLRLLCAGTHGTRDRVVHALEALAILRRGGLEADMTIAGSFQWPHAERDFDSVIQKLGLHGHVTRLLRFSQADAVAMYQGHDILVHPKFMDPCPTVVLEALACGLPVVGSGSGGMPEIVDDSCGVLIPAPKDWDFLHTPSGEALAEAISKAIDGLAALSSGARRRAEERFSVAPWVDAHRRIFSNLTQ